MSRVIRLLLASIFLACFSMASTSPVSAVESTESGLLISPPRFNMTVGAGGTDTQKITVANRTNQDLSITMSVEEFSVADLSYTYQIKEASDPWLRIEQTYLQLKQGEDTTLSIAANVPSNAPPGGKYYLIVASTNTKKGALTSTIQVAAPVYITVNGHLELSSQLREAAPASHFIVGDTVPFHVDIYNSGNTHYTVTTTGHLEGIFTQQSTTSSQHILLPDKTRRIETAIPAPVLPGLYRMVYGYTSSGNSALVSTWIVYLPPWSIVLTALIVWAGFIGTHFLRRRRGKVSTDSPQPPYTSPK